LKKLRKKKHLVGDRSPWWHFIHDWPNKMDEQTNRFISGDYRFEPMNFYAFKDEGIQTWRYQDTLFTRALYQLIKPTFKSIFSERCMHLNGPTGVTKALDLVSRALATGEYRYFMRVDVANFYASINHKILLSQINELYHDPRVLNYLEQVVTIPVIKHAEVQLPTVGIARRSSISPFLGAVYLAPLDRLLEKSEGIFYIKFCDDILVLSKSKSQHLSARRKLQNTLDQLKLKVSKTKTKMGILEKGFHFLGIDFKIKQSITEKSVVEEGSAPQTVETQTHVSMLHERCCMRVEERLRCMKEDAIPLAKVQHSLALWAAWWSRTSQTIQRSTCLARFCLRTFQREDPSLLWLGLELLVTRFSVQLQTGCSTSRYHSATIG
jgi:RNA-directed DNA polymerase